jgi:hypothetical protein
MYECLYLFLDNSPANVWVLYEINAANANALPEAHRSTKPHPKYKSVTKSFTGPARSLTSSFILRDAA